MERDDIYEYSLDGHHNEEAGKKIRKKIWQVTALLTAITILEVIVGIFLGRSSTSGMLWQSVKWGYIILTLIKAGYIVMVFMHLGDEKKSLRYIILVPYFIFMAYLIFVMINEANAVHGAWETYHF
ncbi:MAG: cytochrome C oxidase subunit IV family protein [Bacteroidota bacterium]